MNPKKQRQQMIIMCQDNRILRQASIDLGMPTELLLSPLAKLSVDAAVLCRFMGGEKVAKLAKAYRCDDATVRRALTRASGMTVKALVRRRSEQAKRDRMIAKRAAAMRAQDEAAREIERMRTERRKLDLDEGQPSHYV